MSPLFTLKGVTVGVNSETPPALVTRMLEVIRNAYGKGFPLSKRSGKDELLVLYLKLAKNFEELVEQNRELQR